MIEVNYLAILVSGIISIILGSLWYGPLFGKPWMQIMGFSKESMTEEQKKGMIKNYALMFVGSLLTAYILSHVITLSMLALGGSGISVGLQTGFWLWLGLVLPVQLSPVLWEGKPWRLLFINSGYNLVFMLIIGMMLSVW